MPQPEAILGRIEHGERTRLAAEDHQQLLPSGDVLHVLLDAEQAGPGIADMLGHFAAEAKKRLSARIADQKCLDAGVCDLVYARIGVKSRHGTFADLGPRGADGKARVAHGRRSASADRKSTRLNSST